VFADPLRSGMRFSSDTRKVMPSRFATAWASLIMPAASSRVSGKLADVHKRGMGERADGIEGEVAPELEPDFCADIVQHRRLQAARPKAAETAFTRPVTEPSNSPIGKRSPSMWRTTRVQPVRTRVHDTAYDAPRVHGRGEAPFGSTLVTMRPSQSPPWRWKYHQGIPFASE